MNNEDIEVARLFDNIVQNDIITGLAKQIDGQLSTTFKIPSFSGLTTIGNATTATTLTNKTFSNPILSNNANFRTQVKDAVRNINFNEVQNFLHISVVAYENDILITLGVEEKTIYTKNQTDLDILKILCSPELLKDIRLLVK